MTRHLPLTPVVRRASLAAVLLMFTVGSRLAQAELVVNVPDMTVFTDNVNPVQGVLEVFLTLTSPEDMDPPELLSFNVTLSVMGAGNGLSFQTPQQATTMPLFSDGDFTGDFIDADLDGMENDPLASHDAGTSRDAFQNAGLARFPFTIAANVPVDTQYVIDLVDLIEFGDSMGMEYTNVNVTDVGSITVAAIPEPAAWMSLALVASLSSVAGFIYHRARRRCRTAA
jgi:hypothetical protein